jgi:hypothetical protein
MTFNALGKRHAPRIEAAHIDNLRIDNLQNGVVWSGLLEYDPANPNDVLNDPTNDFASIAQADIGCVGWAGHVWFKDTPTFIVRNSMAGHLHAETLEENQTVRIGGKLNSRYDGTGCECIVPAADRGGGGGGGGNPNNEPIDPNSCQGAVPDLFLEDSPRKIVSEEHGTVSVFADLSLAGQVIVNANDLRDTNGNQLPPAQLMTGQVVVPDPINGPRVFAVPGPNAPAPSTNFELPAYPTFPSTFGGGAVGIVPFGVHVPFSQSLNAGLLTSGLNAPYTCDQVTQLEFYGPVVAPTLGSLPVEVKFDNPGAGGALSVASIMEMQGVPNDRRIAFRVADPYRLPNATYTITRISDPNSLIGLLCDVPLQPRVAAIEDNTAPAGFDYLVDRDCDLSCQPNTCLDVPWFFCNDIDFNNDGLFPDDNDLVDYLIVLAGGPCSTGSCDSIDFNNDGLFPSDTDLIAFLQVKAGGDCIVSP